MTKVLFNFYRIWNEENNKVNDDSKNKKIPLNYSFPSNIFTYFTCIINNVPLIIVGKHDTVNI